MSNIVIVNGINVIEELENTKRELTELKRDVRRYFDLGHIEEPSTEQFEEYLKLTTKLLKVGKEK